MKFQAGIPSLFKTTIKGGQFWKQPVKINGATYNDAIRWVNEKRQSIAEKRKGQDFYFQVATKYEGYGYKSSKTVDLHSDVPVSVFDPRDSDRDSIATIQELTLYLIKMPPKKGGTDFHNDCLFISILKSFDNTKQMPTNYKTRAGFKKSLGIPRDDPIGVEHIPEIEDIFQMKINIVGDHVYTSGKAYLKEITIILKNGHFDLQKTHSSNIVRKQMMQCVDKPKKHVIFRVFWVEKRVEFCDGITIWEDKTDGIKAYDFLNRQPQHPKSEFWFLDFKKLKSKKEEDNDLMILHKKYIEMITTIYDKTDGLVDLFKCSTMKNATKRAVYFRMRSYGESMESITLNEFHWLEECTIGALIYHLTADCYNTFYYDVNSMYPYRLNSLYIPIKEGEFNNKAQEYLDIIKNDQTKTHFMVILRVRIEGQSLLFKFNKYNKYTNFDILSAIQLGLKIQVINDEEANALYYPLSSCITGSKLFDGYITELYNLKKDGILGAKEALNILWGALVQQKKEKYYVKDANQEGDISEGIFNSIRTTALGEEEIKMTNEKTPYITDLARLKPFLLSSARYKMVQLLKDTPIDDIVRIHTDGVSLKKMNDKMRVSTKMGEMKYKHVL